MTSNKNAPLLSIIVPIYNADKYLNRCVDSILNQTLSNIEVILVDDGSTDNSGYICDEYSLKDGRVVAIHIPNGGVSVARNKGLEMAKGEYIGFVDSDDEILPDMYENLYLISKDNSKKIDFDVAICNFTSIYPKNKKVICKHMLIKNYIGSKEIKNNILYRFYTDNTLGLPTACNKIYRSSFLKNNNLLFQKGVAIAEDWLFNFNVFKYANSVVTTDLSLYLYYQNPKSAMHVYRKNRFELWKNNKLFLLEQNKQLNFTIDYDIFYSSFIYKVHNYILNTIKYIPYSEKKIKKIIKDEMMHQALSYSSNQFSLWIRILNFLIKNRLYAFALLFYKIIYILKKFKNRDFK